MNAELQIQIAKSRLVLKHGDGSHDESSHGNRGGLSREFRGQLGVGESTQIDEFKITRYPNQSGWGHDQKRVVIERYRVETKGLSTWLQHLPTNEELNNLRQLRDRRPANLIELTPPRRGRGRKK